MDRKIYPSDISREQFALISEMLGGAAHRICPRSMDLYDVFCAIVYLLKSACTLRAMPSDFPGWQTVRYYFDLWRRSGEEDGLSLLEQALKKSGYTRAYRNWARQKDNVLHRQRAERQAYRYGAGERTRRGQESIRHQASHRC